MITCCRVVGVCQPYMTCGYFVHNFICVLIKWHIDDFIWSYAYRIEAPPSFLHTYSAHFIHSSYISLVLQPQLETWHQHFFFLLLSLNLPPEIFLVFFFSISFSLFFVWRIGVKFNFIMTHFLNNNIFSWILRNFTHFIFGFMWNELSHFLTEMDCLHFWLVLGFGNKKETKIICSNGIIIMELESYRNYGFDDSWKSMILWISNEFKAIILWNFTRLHLCDFGSRWQSNMWLLLTCSHHIDGNSNCVNGILRSMNGVDGESDDQNVIVWIVLCIRTLYGFQSKHTLSPYPYNRQEHLSIGLLDVWCGESIQIGKTRSSHIMADHNTHAHTLTKFVIIPKFMCHLWQPFDMPWLRKRRIVVLSNLDDLMLCMECTVIWTYWLCERLLPFKCVSNCNQNTRTPTISTGRRLLGSMQSLRRFVLGLSHGNSIHNNRVSIKFYKHQCSKVFDTFIIWSCTMYSRWCKSL